MKKECLISHTVIYDLFIAYENSLIFKMCILKYKGLKIVNTTEDANIKWRAKPPPALKSYINTFILSSIKILEQEIIKSH